MGIPITVIDHNVTRTSLALGCKHLAPVGGTHPALEFAILYHLIKKQLSEDNINKGKYLDFNFIKKSCHGFFDIPNPTTADFYDYPEYEVAGKPALGNPEKYRVPTGASPSAYILGSYTALVDAGLNCVPSIYPDKIGYNINFTETSPDGVEDVLYGKYVPIYSNMPKTPAWAKKITGVPASDIEELVEIIGTEKQVGLFTGWGSNRKVEGEQAPFAINSLAAVCGLWGANGKFWGSSHMSLDKSAEMAAIPGYNAGATATSAQLKG